MKGHHAMGKVCGIMMTSIELKKMIRYTGPLFFAIFHIALMLLPLQHYAQEVTIKELYLPSVIWQVPAKNDYQDPASEFSVHRKLESDNIAIFWAKEYGSNPKEHALGAKRFDPQAILDQCERFYTHYRDTVKMVKKGKSLTDKYKLLFFVIGGEEGTAYGGGAADSIGVMWASSLRLQYPPYGAVAHEMAHSFQYLAKNDGHWAYSSSVPGSKGHSIFEMSAQYMLWQVYPEWLTFENYHLKSYMDKNHYAFLHETNMYHAPHVFEYWSMLHGADFHGRMWRESLEGEDAVLTYKRLVGMEQVAFNDQLFDAYRRFITWDLDRVSIVAAPYANQHKTKLLALGGEKYRVDSAVTPQNYGYNGIKLVVPSSGTKIKLQFKGLAGQAGYRHIDLDNAGWRYGFVAQKTDGTRVYSAVGKDKSGALAFTVPTNTAHLWLVVSGAPVTHRIHLLDGDDSNDEQWPYEFTLANVTVDQTAMR